ncbi:MAG: hypothetical protein LIP02_09730 [Bacteroidales bacterium]|nr:hypothetical protein [Bacteroidales bacterium]
MNKLLPFKKRLGDLRFAWATNKYRVFEVVPPIDCDGNPMPTGLPIFVVVDDLIARLVSGIDALLMLESAPNGME